MIKSENLVEFMHAQPFRPFDIRTSDGRVYTVDHPDFLMRSHSGNVVYYMTDDDRPVMIAMTQIVAIEVLNTPRAA